MRPAALICHPDTRSAAARGIRVQVARKGALLTLGYVIEGDLARLRVPTPRTPRIAGGLWRHTCCEVFIARKGGPAYYEFNFAPSGEWAAYAFARYRAGGPLMDEALNPQIAVRRGENELELDAVIRLERLSSMHVDAGLSLALSAVVEDDAGALSYWALKHPPGNPDFHHSDSFALELDEVRH